ncbi:MAG: hypothetical protein HYU29_01320 [Chloroflexi bacterium]|nr:hypothetical protein [Chloroflexota bacterium]
MRRRRLLFQGLAFWLLAAAFPVVYLGIAPPGSDPLMWGGLALLFSGAGLALATY